MTGDRIDRLLDILARERILSLPKLAGTLSARTSPAAVAILAWLAWPPPHWEVWLPPCGMAEFPNSWRNALLAVQLSFTHFQLSH